MLYIFEGYGLDTDVRELRRGDTVVAVQPQVFDLLEYLIRHRDRVITKDDLIATIWHGRIVSESALTTSINAARTAIGDSGEEQRLIKTLPRKGIRFVGTVRGGDDAAQRMLQGALTTSPLPDMPSIAVLPFTNMSGDIEQEHFADGIAEDIITALSRFRSLFVIARSSTFIYKHKVVDVRQVASELGVRYVLEGSVRNADQRARITAQLIDAETGVHVWAERFDRPLQDIFAVQDEITEKVAATIEPEIGAAEREKARRKPPEHLGAWEHYQRGMWHLLRRNREDLVPARALFRKAIEIDPTFATPYSALALSCFFQITHGFTTDHAASLDELFTEASHAVALDPKDGLAHTALGLAYMERGNQVDAIAEHQIALTLNPNSSLAHYACGYALTRAQRFHEAVDQLDIAVRLNPRDPALWSYLAVKAGALYQLRRFEEAAECARGAARQSVVVDLVWPYVWLAATLGQLGKTNEALAAVEELRKRRPALTVSDVRSWPHNLSRGESALEHLLEGLRLAGVPEQ